MNYKELIDTWKDEPMVHKLINDRFIELVNSDKRLKEYRDWIETNIFGFGERSFLWLWKILVDEMPEGFKFLEVGVFRGQIIGLIRMLSDTADIYGVTPLTGADGHWESDYKADIKHLHDTFNLKQPKIIIGLSTDTEVIELAKDVYDIVYIDGGHTYEVVKSDLFHYSQMVKDGGYLVVDDCCNKYNLPDGHFRGIESVSKAVDEVLPNEQFKELFSVVHNRVFQKIETK